MALFEFKLKDIEEIAPWGEAPDLYLHWFGLTDSFYNLNVQGKELFRYSNEILDYWKKQFPNEKQNEYVDYNVAKLHEDLLEILPDVMQPIPREIYEHINSSNAHQRFIEKINTFEQDLDDEDEKMCELYNDAAGWVSSRRLHSDYLTEGPDVWFLRCKDEITVRWNNENKEIDGIQPWAEIKGEKKYTYQEFMSQVKLFHNRLMSEMQSRIDIITQKNPLPHISIDIASLTEENEQRKDSLINALRNQPSIDNWHTVTFALNKLFK